MEWIEWKDPDETPLPSLTTSNAPSDAPMRAQALRATIQQFSRYPSLQLIAPATETLEQDDHGHDSNHNHNANANANIGIEEKYTVSHSSATKPVHDASLAKKLIVIEEFPVFMKSYRTAFASTLRDFLQAAPHSNARLVVILSDDMGLSPGEQHELLPPDLVSQMTKIAFNPIAPTFLRHALGRILEKEALGKLSCLDAVVEESHGDIRFAIHQLQFESLLEQNKFSLKPSPSSFSLSSSCSSSLAPASFFRVLGNAFYRKSPVPSYESMMEMIKGSGTDPMTLLIYLHEHYATFLAPEDCDCLSELADAFSDAAAIASCYSVGIWQDLLYHALLSLPFRALQLRESYSVPNYASMGLYAFRRPAYYTHLVRDNQKGGEGEAKARPTEWHNRII